MQISIISIILSPNRASYLFIDFSMRSYNGSRILRYSCRPQIDSPGWFHPCLLSASPVGKTGVPLRLPVSGVWWSSRIDYGPAPVCQPTRTWIIYRVCTRLPVCALNIFLPWIPKSLIETFASGLFRLRAAGGYTMYSVYCKSILSVISIIVRTDAVVSILIPTSIRSVSWYINRFGVSFVCNICFGMTLFYIKKRELARAFSRFFCCRKTAPV